ncbi:IS3 family transposase [Herbidospora mongoliensis]|uniref:IS3 family transposase n=1 Tax=Herbidospora mongoliensis TaxID=688067 RepID=UPI000A6CB063
MLNVSESGYFAWRNRPPSPRSLRHAWLTERIRQIHAASRGAYGSRRVHAELKLGSGLIVAYHTVEMLTQREGIRGLPGNPRGRRPIQQVPTAAGETPTNDTAHSAPANSRGRGQVKAALSIPRRANFGYVISSAEWTGRVSPERPRRAVDADHPGSRKCHTPEI